MPPPPPLPEPCLSIVYYGVEPKFHAHECVVPPLYKLSSSANVHVVMRFVDLGVLQFN